jgi:DNA mismatch repair ATPase MutL
MTTLNASQLQQSKLVGYFKSGFILIECKNAIYIIDQHAADERVQLEMICMHKDVLRATEEEKLIACMNAVKLTDELDMVSQEKIIFALSKCSFPFICAHGRPTIILLSDKPPLK